MLGTLAGLSSCLDEVPYGTYSNQTFYNTEADAESALMYAYVPLNYIDYCGRFLFYLGDVPTNQYKSYGKADESPLFQWDITPTSDEAILQVGLCKPRPYQFGAGQCRPDVRYFGCGTEQDSWRSPFPARFQPLHAGHQLRQRAHPFEDRLLDVGLL